MWTTACFVLVAGAQTVTPYWQHETAKINEVRVEGSAKSGEPVELTVDAKATYDNPFNPDEVTLDARITPPKGTPYTLPGYYGRAYRLVDGDMQPTDQKGWRIRFCPTVAGSYQIALTLRDQTGSVEATKTIQVADGSAGDGFVRLSPRDRRYFETSDGKSFYPIGSNVGWGGDNLKEYQRWFPRYGQVGANWARVWLSPAWTTFALETVGKSEDGKGLGLFDQRNAARLDEALRMARQNGLYLQLCIDSYNILRDRDAYNYWEQTPHNRENGGPLRIWSDFWTSPAMDKLYRAKLRYLVARYAAFPNVFSWEFWNEVDITRNYDVEVVRAWHERMGNAVRELDPYHHLVATSFGNSMGERAIDMIPQLDYVQTHYYGPDQRGQTAWQQTRKSSWGKAHFVAEVGSDAGGARSADDPRGIQIHDPLWASIATGASGGAMPWWWDSYIDPKNLYPLFGAAVKFVDGVDWPAEGFRQVRPKVAYAVKPAKPTYRDVVVPSGPVSWEASPSNRPTTVRLTNGQFVGPVPISGIQHGVGGHLDLHNPVRFFMTLSRPTKFAVEVGGVSGYGGAKLAISLDGNRVLTRDFADPDGDKKTDDLTQYAGAYTITVPPGEHAVVVENIGPDWFYVSYRLIEGAVAKTPPVSPLAIAGDKTILVWLCADGTGWSSEAVSKRVPHPAPATVLSIPGVSAGTWTIERWDTWKGSVVGKQTAKVGVDGLIKIAVPAFTRDIAFKVVRR